ncbi:MAG: transporter, partial [Brevundimonas sp.]
MVLPAQLSEIEDARLVRLGGAALTLGEIVSALIVIAVAVALSWLATRALRRARERRPGRHAQKRYLFEKLTGYGIQTARVFKALSA